MLPRSIEIVLEAASDGIEFGSGGRRLTHYGDSAGRREDADGARALSEGVPEHLGDGCGCA